MLCFDAGRCGRCTTLLVAVTVGACGTDDSTGDTTSNLTIDNDSSYTLIEMNLSPTTQINWGPDLLGTDVLEPGDVLERSGIECGSYDIRVVDEDNDECILDSVDLCASNSVWQIDNAELAFCAF